jgi:hypothetical protein
MKTRRDALGRVCLLASFGALYLLLGMKAYVAWREGLWLDWPLGDYLPDAVVHWVFAFPDSPTRSTLEWLMGRDVLYYAAAVSLVLWLLNLSGGSSVITEDEP